MPKLGCNGYSVFAEQMRPALEEKFGKKFTRFNELIRAAAPYWEALSEDEKRQWKERAKDYKRGDEFQCRKKNVRLRNFDKRQSHRPPAGGDDVEEIFEAEEMDEEDADFHDPMELPGPVNLRSSLPGSPTKKASLPGSPTKKCYNAFDFVSGKRSGISSLLASLKLDDGSSVKTRFVKVPPRFRNENGSGDQEFVPISFFNESQKFFHELEHKSLSNDAKFKELYQISDGCDCSIFQNDSIKETPVKVRFQHRRLFEVSRSSSDSQF